jgi:hypothetical protein
VEDQAMPQAVLLDISGVLYQDALPLPGSVAAVEALQSKGCALRLVTNTSRLTCVEMYRQLTGMGYALQPEQIYSAPRAVRHYLQAHDLRPYFFRRRFNVSDQTGQLGSCRGWQQRGPLVAPRARVAVSATLTDQNRSVSRQAPGEAGCRELESRRPGARRFKAVQADPKLRAQGLQVKLDWAWIFPGFMRSPVVVRGVKAAITLPRRKFCARFSVGRFQHRAQDIVVEDEQWVAQSQQLSEVPGDAGGYSLASLFATQEELNARLVFGKFCFQRLRQRFRLPGTEVGNQWQLAGGQRVVCLPNYFAIGRERRFHSRVIDDNQSLDFIEPTMFEHR